MAAPRSMMAHILNPLKGWPNNAALDFHAPMASAVFDTVPIVYAGSVVHLNTSGEYELGVPKTVGKWHMPLFLFPNSDDPDVSNDGGISGTSGDDPDGWAAVKRNNMTALVASGGYEFETTEYETDETYEPGDALKADTADNGKVSNGVQYTDPIVGIVSRGVKTLGQLSNRHALAFWPANLPATP